ncbi:MAG: hypothetical protein ACOCRX_11125 [Candidatus Woesearchaeota archaeon]
MEKKKDVKFNITTKEKVINKTNIEKRLFRLFNSLKVEEGDKKEVIDYVNYIVDEMSEEANLVSKLELLFSYEKNYLELISEYKEEIKFANNMQEELRRERTQFFSQDLKEVAKTLKEANVDSKVASNWIEELVDSYTNSLNLSTELTKTQIIDIVAELRESSGKEINNVKRGLGEGENTKSDNSKESNTKND